ncbi:putative nucleotidyltransferase, ribonuclease H [Tanacetum coccineum]
MVRDNSGPGVFRPLFEENIKFEFWGQCIEELKDNVFLGNNDENPLEHILNITSIVNILQSLGVSRDQHKINEHEQLQIFYQGLDPETRKKADFMGYIPRMTPAAGIKAINKLSKHSLSWYKEEEYKENDFDKVLKHINDFKHNISVLNEEVRMVQHQYKTPNDERDSFLEETVSSFIKEAHWMQKKSENLIWRIKRNYDKTFKNQASAIKTIEKNLGRIDESIHGRRVGTLPSFTETNPRGLAHAITTRSGLNFQPPKNPLEDSNVLQNITTEHIPTTEKITLEQTHNSTKKPDPPIPFPSRLKKEKEKEQFQKFLKNLQQLHINIPFIESLEQMPKYAKFMKDLLSKRGKGSEASKIILNEQCSAVVLNKVPPKEKDPGGFTIPCVIGQSGITKALADLGASISLIPYSMFLRLNLGDLKPTRMCIELANKTTQFLKGIAENVMVKIDKFVFPVDFVILDMEEDHIIPIILGRPFLATAHAMIDDTCHSADIIDLSVVDSIKEILPQNHDNSIEPILDHLPEDCNNPNLFAANSIDEEIPTPKLKELPSHLEYAFLDNNRELPVIISSLLSDQEKRLNPKVQDVVKTEILKLLDAGLIYAISDSPWVSPIHVVPKKGGTTVIANKDNELIPTRTVTGWRVCIDYRKLNDATRKDHFPLPFIDQMLERLSGNEYYCFLDGFSGYFQIPLAPEDQEKTTFTCPYGTFAYRRMPFGLCNAPATFQRCMTAIFHDMCKDFMEVFMDDFSVFGNSFRTCLNNLSKMLARCEETNLVLNWEKCHFMVKEGIVLGHKISKAGIEVDKAKVDVIASLPYPTNVKVVYTDHSALKYLFSKQDAKPRLIKWVLLLQEFTIEIKDKKGTENLAADHLSRLENPGLEELNEDTIQDNFPDEHLMVIKLKNTETDPWYVDYADYVDVMDHLR